MASFSQTQTTSACLFVEQTTRKQWLIKQIVASNNPAAANVLAALTSCSLKTACRSAACPACGLLFQRLAVMVVKDFIDVPAQAIRGRQTLITIAPAVGCQPFDKISAKVFRQVGVELTTVFAKLGLPTTIIGLEASFNEDTTGEVEAHVCVHGHALQIDWLSEDQVEALKVAFSRSTHVKRPVFCQPLDSDPRGRAYPFKPQRTRRITVWAPPRLGRGRYRQTKSRPLRPQQAISLAIAEHELGFKGRLLVCGLNVDAVWGRFEALGWPFKGPDKLE